jgi:hypothetical protein
MSFISRADFFPYETIYIRVWEYGGGTTGTFGISVTSPQPLPVELLYFEGTKYKTFNSLKWATASEQNSSHFDIERSEDGEIWKFIANKTAAGNSQTKINYSHLDSYINQNNVYYRLLQYDIDGKFEIYGPIVIEGNYSNKKVIKFVNLLGQEINENYKGVLFEIYEDGTMKRIIR